MGYRHANDQERTAKFSDVGTLTKQALSATL